MLRVVCDSNGQNCQPVGGLLWDMYLLKASDVAPADPDDSPIVYYAFVPITNSSGTWFSSGIAGIGWIGFRESVGLNLGIMTRPVRWLVMKWGIIWGGGMHPAVTGRT